MSYRVNSHSHPTFGTFSFSYLGDNKTVEIEIGQDGDLYIGDVLEAVKDVMLAGGFDYVDEIRAVNYGAKENTIHSSNSEEGSWREPADGLPENDLPRVMAEETLREIGEISQNPIYTD